MSEPLAIRYRFDLPDGSQKTFNFTFDPASFRLSTPPPADAAVLDRTGIQPVRQLPAEPCLAPALSCRVADGGRLEPLNTLVSFDTVGVTVLQSERTVYAETTAQQAMSSVLGLIMATAGCPWTDRLRPMARFHLPFANEAETLIEASRCSFCRAR